MMTAAWVVHRAGPMSSEGIQSCTRCAAVLADHSTAGLDKHALSSLRWRRNTPIARMDGDATVSVPWTGALLDDMRPCTEDA